MTDRAERRLSPISQYPVHPFLFAAYAVLFLYSQNLAAVLLVDVGDPLAVAIVQAIVFYAGATILLRSFRRGAVVASAILIAWYGFGHAAPGLAELGLGERTQLGLWLFGIAGAVTYAVFARRSLPTVTALLNIFAAVLVVFTLVSIVPYEVSRGARPVADVEAGLTGIGRCPADARRLLLRLRSLRVGELAQDGVRDHGQRPVRLAGDARLPGRGGQPRELPRDGLLARGDAQHDLPGPPDRDDRSGLGRPDPRAVDAAGPPGREGVPGAGVSLLPSGLVVRTHRDQCRSRREHHVRGHQRVRVGPPRYHGAPRDRAGPRRPGRDQDVLRAPRRPRAVPVAAGQAPGVRAGTQVRLCAHPPAARSLRLPRGRHPVHGGGGPATWTRRVSMPGSCGS